ncbi:MAG: hypothetical protein MUF58_19830 [Arcicella sp.]|jgi:hypothetical protein|nr:hypothetical protein [Arcicella sp.]
MPEKDEVEKFRNGYSPNLPKKTIVLEGLLTESHRSESIKNEFPILKGEKILCLYLGAEGDINKTFHAIHFAYDKSNVVHYIPDEANQVDKIVEIEVYEDAGFIGIGKSDDNLGEKYYTEIFKNLEVAKIVQNDRVTTSPQTQTHRNSPGV